MINHTRVASLRGLSSFTGTADQFDAGMTVQFDRNTQIGPAGKPYVAYQDGSSGPVRVESYDSGTSKWADVASAGGLSSNAASHISLAIRSSGTPYVAYQGASGSVAIEKYDSGTSKWVSVGSPAFNTVCSGSGPSQCISLAVAPGGVPYVAFPNVANGGKVTVEKYTTASASPGWVAVGQAGFSANTASYISLTLDQDGMPYVGYQDGASGPVTVEEFDQDSARWLNVGNSDTSPGGAAWISLADTPTGIPYVAYTDLTQGGAVAVKRAQ